MSRLVGVTHGDGDHCIQLAVSIQLGSKLGFIASGFV